MDKTYYGVKQGRCMCRCFEVWPVGEDWHTHSDFYHDVFERREDAEAYAAELNIGRD